MLIVFDDKLFRSLADALVEAIKRDASSTRDAEPCTGSLTRQCSDVSSFDECDDRDVLAPLSNNLYFVLSSEKEDVLASNYPREGAVVRLVGRIAFPCVCEVTESSSELFLDERSCVVADGVRWQSLYLVFAGKYMLLAEPVKNG